MSIAAHRTPGPCPCACACAHPCFPPPPPSVVTRLVDTCKKISKMAAAALVVFFIFLGIISQANNYQGSDALKVTLMSVANAYGLFVIVFLLGYGLVEFPKFLFKFGDDKVWTWHPQRRACAHSNTSSQHAFFPSALYATAPANHRTARCR